MTGVLTQKTVYVSQNSSDQGVLKVHLSIFLPEKIGSGTYEVAFRIKTDEGTDLHRSAHGADEWQALMGGIFMMKALLKHLFTKDETSLFQNPEDVRDSDKAVSVKELFLP